MSALILHLNLDRPSKDAKPKEETVLIWGGSSTIGFYAIQIASQVRVYLLNSIESSTN
jgi:NADPH:quinone reductase-like Zn-dependent oxidoreductase